MTIPRVINGYTADENGVITLPIVTSVGSQEGLRMWTGITMVEDGEWSVDYSDANFSQIRNIQVTLESNTNTDADRPSSAYVVNYNNTSANGRAWSATSIGLLLGMIQNKARDGVTVHVLVIGK